MAAKIAQFVELNLIILIDPKCRMLKIKDKIIRTKIIIEAYLILDWEDGYLIFQFEW